LTIFASRPWSYGNHANNRQRIDSPGISPPRGSHPTALFGCDGSQCKALLQRSTFDWTGCWLSAACHGVIRAVLPHYLFQKKQAACSFREQQAESICRRIIWFSRSNGGKQKMPLTFHGEK